MANHVIYDRLWESGRLARCSRDAALAYPWIFLVADDHGRFEFNPRRICTKVFGSRDDVTREDVVLWLSEYEREGLLIRYHMDGDLAYWRGFRGRKPSERRPSEYPDPAQFSRRDKSRVRGRKIAGEGATNRGSTRDKSTPEVEQIKSRTDQEQNRAEDPAATQPAVEVFEHWKLVTAHPDAKLIPGSKRDKALRARLKDGYTVEQLKRAINGCKASAFHMGENERKEVYDDLELICRSAEKVEQFMARIKQQPETTAHSKFPWEKVAERAQEGNPERGSN